MAAPQTYANHTRWFPLYHFVVVPLLLVNLGVAVTALIRGPSPATAWQTVLAAVLILLGVSARMMALTVQNRLVRLEERLRLRDVLPAELRSAVADLRTRHLIALRFAADEEVPDLVRRIRAGELDRLDDIKRAIRTWRPDRMRA
jgi:hypothetical protein